MEEEIFNKRFVPWISYREMEDDIVFQIVSVKKLESVFGIALLFCLRLSSQDGRRPADLWSSEYNVIVDDEKYINWNAAQRLQIKKYTIKKIGTKLIFKLSNEEKEKIEKDKRKKVKPRKELKSDDEDSYDREAQRSPTDAEDY